VEAVFTEALGEEAEVELVQAIGRGDECCEFVVRGPLAPQGPIAK
jgi:predicted hydrocarbon binding protein